MRISFRDLELVQCFIISSKRASFSAVKLPPSDDDVRYLRGRTQARRAYRCLQGNYVTFTTAALAFTSSSSHVL